MQIDCHVKFSNSAFTWVLQHNHILGSRTIWYIQPAKEGGKSLVYFNMIIKLSNLTLYGAPLK